MAVVAGGIGINVAAAAMHGVSKHRCVAAAIGVAAIVKSRSWRGEKQALIRRHRSQYRRNGLGIESESISAKQLRGGIAQKRQIKEITASA